MSNHYAFQFTVIIKIITMFRSKQLSSRQKHSLRNLINMELQSNIASTIDPRPKTMYTQRQLKIFQQQRVKLFSQHKLRRMSSQQLPSKRPQSQASPKDKQEKTKLKHLLGKINLLAGGNITIQENDRISTISNFLQSLSRTQNFYQEAFKYIHQTFNEVVFTKLENWDYNSLEFVASQSKNQLLIKLLRGLEGITYKQLSVQMFEVLLEQVSKFDQFKQDTRHQFQQLELRMIEKNNVIAKLSNELNFHQNHPSKDQFSYIHDLQSNKHQLQMENRKLISRIKQLQDNLDYLNQFNNMLDQRLEQMKIKLYDYQVKEFSGLKDVESNSELAMFENNVEVLKDIIHKGALRMAAVREEYSKIEGYNQQLLGERSVLAKRAAVGFAQLTPRPNYAKLFEENGFNYEKIVPNSQKKPSTEQIVKVMLKSFKKIYKSEAKNMQEKVQQSESPHQKDFYGPIIDDLQVINKQIKKVEGLGQQVRQSHNRKKEQKDKVVKKR